VKYDGVNCLNSQNKNMYTSLRGLVFSFVALLLVTVPNTAFGQWNMSNNQSNAASFGVSTSTPTTILTNIINYALAIVGFLGVLGFIIAGIMYLLAAGDEDTAKKAKGYMVNSIIGIVVALLGYVVMAAISTLLGAGGATMGL
jgi:uncharacterized membrane protein YjgN (DUF898 family)